jgi:hypothetical protein
MVNDMLYGRDCETVKLPDQALYGRIFIPQGPLAQWQSTRLIPDGFRVRLLGGPPFADDTPEISGVLLFLALPVALSRV